MASKKEREGRGEKGQTNRQRVNDRDECEREGGKRSVRVVYIT